MMIFVSLFKLFRATKTLPKGCSEGVALATPARVSFWVAFFIHFEVSSGPSGSHFHHFADFAGFLFALFWVSAKQVASEKVEQLPLCTSQVIFSKLKMNIFPEFPLLQESRPLKTLI